MTIFNVIEGTSTSSVGPGAISLFTFTDAKLVVSGPAIGTLPVYHVTGNADVAVFVFDPLADQANNDACLVVPVPTLGKKYRVATYQQLSFTYQYVLVVATALGS